MIVGRKAAPLQGQPTVANCTGIKETPARAVKIYGPGQTALQAAISAYNTGSLVNGFDNGYVQKVVNAAKYEVPELAPTVVSRPAGQSKSVGSRVAGAGRQKQAGTNKNQQFMEAKLAAIEVNFGDK